jgi:hypothetical protein
MVVLCVGAGSGDAGDGATALRVGAILPSGDSVQESRWTTAEMPAPALLERSRPRTVSVHGSQPALPAPRTRRRRPRRASRRALPRALLIDPDASA